MKPNCCEFMNQQLNYKCDQHKGICPDQVLNYDPSVNQGTNNPRAELVILIAPNAEYECNYCPSCGTKIDFKPILIEPKYICDFCNKDISDLNGKVFCEGYCFENTLGSHPYGVTAKALHAAAVHNCEYCAGTGHQPCEECDDKGHVSFPGNTGILWKPKA